MTVGRLFRLDVERGEELEIGGAGEKFVSPELVRPPLGSKLLKDGVWAIGSGEYSGVIGASVKL
jgi:hypothetical protein